MAAIKELVLAIDPISEDAFRSLIEYREEDLYVDYKESFDQADSKQWLELTKDVMAFANTHGGYIVLGVRYQPFEVIGLSENTVHTLTDVNNVLQKINRYVMPPFTEIRSKCFNSESKKVAVVFIPESRGRTHIITREATHKFPDGKTKTILSPGMIYIRQSGTNQIISSDAFEAIVDRRIEHYKATLFGRISKVIDAPLEHEISFIDPKDPRNGSRKVKISGDADALPIKGVGFSTPPKTDQEEIAGWIALRIRDEHVIPRTEKLWYLYANRLALKDTLTEEQISELLKFNLLTGVPPFFWFQFVEIEKRREIIKECLDILEQIQDKARVLHVGASEGRGFYNALLKKMGKARDRLNQRSRKFPDDIGVFFNPSYFPAADKRSKSKIKSHELLEEELSRLSSKLSLSRDEDRELSELWEATALDFYLYAPKKKKQKDSSTIKLVKLED